MRKLICQVATNNFRLFPLYASRCKHHRLILRKRYKENEFLSSISFNNSGYDNCRRVLSTATERSNRRCWKCNSSTDAEKELYFCRCGVVQSVPSDLTYFKALNVPENFDIDTTSLSQYYKDLQKELHPDKYTQKSKEEQELAAGQSSFINKAYEALLKPLTRGFYLLELRGVPLEEVEEAVNPAFLMEIMETNEDIIDVASNPPVLQQIQEANNAKMDDCVQVVAEAFRNGDFALAKNTLIKLKYFTNIDGKIKGIHRNNMDST